MDITLFVEHQCNLRCDYCYTGEKFRRTMDEETIEDSIELALSDAPRSVTLSFFGGEPLLRFPLLVRAVELYRERFARLLHPPELKLVLNTNATLLDAPIVEWLARERFSLNVSLDGPAHVHDRHRRDAAGKGSHFQTERGLELLRTAGLPLRLNAVVMPETAGRLGETTARLFEHDPNFASLTPNLAAEWSDDALAAFRYGVRQAALVWEREFRAGRARNFEPFLGKVLSHTQGGIATGPRCGSMLKEVTVAHSGNLYGCAQQVGEDSDPSLRIGHVRTGIDAELVRKKRTLAANVETVCGECELRTRCSSSCACKQLSAAGAIGRIDGVLCATEEAFVDAADAVAERLYSERNESFLELVYARRWALREGAELTQLRRASSPLRDLRAR